ncbi:MAG: hypothetical protein IKX16_07335, partial [Clostridia bacterium]|nr:hypothetical protein [Clostridia bacterium]
NIFSNRVTEKPSEAHSPKAVPLGQVALPQGLSENKNGYVPYIHSLAHLGKPPLLPKRGLKMIETSRII